MNNKTFGIVVGIIIALALAMFAGLYMLGLSSDGGSSFNDGYNYDYEDTSTYLYDDEDTAYYDDFAGDELFDAQQSFYPENDSDFYFDEGGNAYNLDEFEFENLGNDATIIDLEI